MVVCGWSGRPDCRSRTAKHHFSHIVKAVVKAYLVIHILLVRISGTPEKEDRHIFKRMSKQRGSTFDPLSVGKLNGGIS